jgi:hypothetical protein
LDRVHSENDIPPSRFHVLTEFYLNGS